jgi:hypothetical protein
MLPYTAKGPTMATKTLKSIERRIQTLKRRLVDVRDMRPGTLSVQYRDPTERKKPFNQISYTHKGQSRSEYVRVQNLETVRGELSAYKTFKAIVDEIIDLSIKASRTRCNTRTQ